MRTVRVDFYLLSEPGVKKSKVFQTDLTDDAAIEEYAAKLLASEFKNDFKIVSFA
ncbi:hypothetical protein [Paenibacillus polymyxa]|uniref:hypothetical protein n=1 Tax=Paenibacillus polymyxa TaxID=1406 RepID=UPI00129AC01F|nr:hypothetical protein [Paenibacillus polymyxa]MCJ1222288.1 hypothetical protein [Paenibacillus polymyxa]